jgi:hypothetical protein
LVAVLLAALAVSALVDHGRSGGAVVPGATAAARVLGQTSGGGARGDGGSSPEALAELIAGGLAPPTGISHGGIAPPLTGAPDGEPPDDEGGETAIPLPPAPQVDTIALPEQVRPLSQLAAPVAFEACQYLGAVPLVFALGGVTGALPVDSAELLPYMKPLFDLCLVVGVPETDTRCQVDDQLDDGADVPEIPAALGLTVGEVIEGIPLPTPVGVFIDELEAIERLVLGPPAPGETDRFSDRLTEALACSQR